MIYDQIDQITEGFILVVSDGNDGARTTKMLANPAVSQNKNAVALYQSVFANMDGKRCNQLENSRGEILVQFNETLADCSNAFADGLALLTDGKPNEAQAALQKVLALQPDNQYLLQALVESSAAAGNTQEHEGYEKRFDQYMERVAAQPGLPAVPASGARRLAPRPASSECTVKPSAPAEVPDAPIEEDVGAEWGDFGQYGGKWINIEAADEDEAYYRGGLVSFG